MSATGRGAQRDALDFYSTPAWATDAILDVIRPEPHHRILEPAAGDGAIVTCLLARGVGPTAIDAVEIEPARAAACRATTGVDPIVGDFMNSRPRDFAPFDLIITNPPFARAEKFARLCLDFAHAGTTIAMLLRLNWLGSGKRVSFHREHPAHVYVLPKRPAFGGAKGTDACEYGWFLWGRGADPGRWAVLDVARVAA